MAWATSLALLGGILVTGHNLRPILMFTLSVAITASVGFLVAAEREPLHEVYDLGFTAGWSDRDRSGRPIVMPQSTVHLRRLDDRVHNHLDAS